MQNEEQTDDTQVETQEGETVVVEEATAEDTTETTNTVDETPEAKLAKAEAEAAKYRRLFEKTQKQKVTPQARPQAPQSASSPVDVDERILAAQGMAPELIKELKKVAKVLDVGLIEAQTDTIFVAVKEKFEKEQKQKKASVGASRGSGNVAPKKDFNTPGLTREEHLKLVQSI